MRQYMEDRHVVLPRFLPDIPKGGDRVLLGNAGLCGDGSRGSYCAVFDGHNGAHAADMAAKRLHLLMASDEALGAWYPDRAKDVPSSGEIVKEGYCPVGSSLERNFLELDREIIRETRAQNTRDGCTALVLLQVCHK